MRSVALRLVLLAPLAAGNGCATQVNPDALARVLRALTVPGVLVDLGDGRYGLTPVGETLKKGVPGSMHAMRSRMRRIARRWPSAWRSPARPAGPRICSSP